MYVHTYTHTHIYIYIHMYKDTYIHEHTQTYFILEYLAVTPSSSSDLSFLVNMDPGKQW